MLKVYGSKNCARCTIVKDLLTRKGVDFKYKMLSDLPDEERKELIKQTLEKGSAEMPIIVRDGKVITLQEVNN